MPAGYRIDRTRNCVCSRASGTLNDDDLMRHRRELRADHHFHSRMNQLWDFRDVDRIDVATETIRDLAQHSPFARESRRALVVASSLSYGLARMFQAYATDCQKEVDVFYDFETANSWLDSDEPSRYSAWCSRFHS